MYSIQLTGDAKKQLHKLPTKSQEKFFQIITLLAKDPLVGKKLKGRLEGCLSVRLWPYRIIYMVNKPERTVTIITVAHRQEVYQ